MDIHDKIKQYIDRNKYKSTVTKFRLALVVIYVLTVVALAYMIVSITPSGLFLALGGIAVVIGVHCFIYKKVLDIADRALLIDGDPIKWLTIYSVIKNPVFFRYNFEATCMATASWLGKFEEASLWADILIGSNKAKYVASGYNTKARASFFLGDYFTMRECIGNYRTTVQRHHSKKSITQYYAFNNDFLNLFEAIADGNTDKIAAYGKTLASVETGAATVSSQVEYFKGLAAYLSGNYSDAARWFKLACECKDKTVYPTMAKEYLDKLGDYANVSLYGDSIEINPEKYDSAIKSLRKASTNASRVYNILYAIVFIVAVPLIYILQSFSRVYVALGVIAAIFLIRFLFNKYSAKLWAPLNNFLYIEGNPEKYLNVIMAFETAITGCYLKLWRRLTVALASGDFDDVLFYAVNAIPIVDNSRVSSLLFVEARAEYFLGRFSDMKSTIERYRLSLNRGNIFGEDYVTEQKCDELLKLLEAIVEGDEIKIATYGKSIVPWSKSVIVHSQVEYFKGVAAYITNDIANATQHFKKAQELGAKTINYKLAQDYLDKIEK